MSFFHSTEPSAYPDAWDRWPVDGAGDDYCGQCGADQPDDPANHSMYCEFSDYDGDYCGCCGGEGDLPSKHDESPCCADLHDTIAEQTGEDR